MAAKSYFQRRLDYILGNTLYINDVQRFSSCVHLPVSQVRLYEVGKNSENWPGYPISVHYSSAPPPPRSYAHSMCVVYFKIISNIGMSVERSVHLAWRQISKYQLGKSLRIWIAGMTWARYIDECRAHQLTVNEAIGTDSNRFVSICYPIRLITFE